MPHLMASSKGRSKPRLSSPNPDDTVPRFESAADMAALTAQTRSWPESTRAISKLGISVESFLSDEVGESSGACPLFYYKDSSVTNKTDR